MSLDAKSFHIYGVPANLNAVGALSASMVEEAIADAVYSAGPLLLR